MWARGVRAAVITILWMVAITVSQQLIYLYIYICLCSPEQLENPLLCMISRILLYPDTPQTQAQHLLGIMKILCI
jgi:hypothetical protein